MVDIIAILATITADVIITDIVVCTDNVTTITVTTCVFGYYGWSFSFPSVGLREVVVPFFAY